MRKIVILAAIAMSLSTIRGAWAEGDKGNGIDRGGGDDLALEFVSIGYEIADLLDRWQSLPGPGVPGLNPEAFRRAVKTTLVERKERVFIRLKICEYHPEVAALPDCKVPDAPRNQEREVEVTASNSADEGSIHLSAALWPASAESKPLRMSIVLHEYLGILRLSDRFYEVSQAFFRRLVEERSVVTFREGLHDRIAELFRRFEDYLQGFIRVSSSASLVTLRTLRRTLDFQICTQAPASGSPSPEQTDACKRVLEAFGGVPMEFLRLRQDTSRERTERLKAFYDDYMAFAGEQPTEDRQGLAYDSLTRMNNLFASHRPMIEAELNRSFADLQSVCGGLMWKSVPCLFDHTEQEFTVRIPAMYTDLLHSLQQLRDSTFAEIAAFVDRPDTAAGN